MTTTVKGLTDFQATLAKLGAAVESNILRGAMRAGLEVVADRARANTLSSEIRASIGTTTRVQPGLVTGAVQTKGKGAYLAPWEEFGTDPHFIAVDDEEGGGRTVRRINKLTKKGALNINGTFAKTVHHPGAKRHPFMRHAADTSGNEVGTAMVAYVTQRLAKLDAATLEPESNEE